MPTSPSFYDVLGIPTDATAEEIRRAYRELSRQSHPDLNPEPGSTTKFLGIQEAFEILSDVQKRKEYDTALEEQWDKPVRINIIYSRSTIPPINQPQWLYALIKISATPKFKALSNPARNICLVLDRSTSMGGIRLDVVKNAAIELIRQSHPDDILSAISFSDRAEILFPAERNFDRHKAETEIRMIHVGGGTEIYQGLEAGYQQLQHYLNKALINHIFLITDGHTYGDEKNCLNLADRVGEQGAQITALGIGTDWNDEFLDELTRRTGGTAHFLSNPGGLQDLLREKFIRLNQIFGEKLLCTGNWSPGVELCSAFRLSPDAAPLMVGEKVLFGNLLKEEDLTLLLELKIHPEANWRYRHRLFEGILEMILPYNHGAIFHTPLNMNRRVAPVDKKELPPSEIINALTNITLYRIQERARNEARAGKIEAASSHLRLLASHLYTLGQVDLAKTTLMEAENIRKTNLLSDEGQKLIKYGTRALLPALSGRYSAE